MSKVRRICPFCADYVATRNRGKDCAQCEWSADLQRLPTLDELIAGTWFDGPAGDVRIGPLVRFVLGEVRARGKA